MPVAKERLESLRELADSHSSEEPVEVPAFRLLELLDEIQRLRKRVHAAAAGKCMECGKVLDLNYIECCRRPVHVHTPDCKCDV